LKKPIWTAEALIEALDLLDDRLGLTGPEAERLIADFEGSPYAFRVLVGHYAWLTRRQREWRGLDLCELREFLDEGVSE
jgi:hypothetical protein